jgi:hypothetical protein
MFDDAKQLGWKAFGLNKIKRKGYSLGEGVGESLTFISKMREGMIYVDGPHVKIPFGFNSELNVRVDKSIWIIRGCSN